jgi:hypothetical protein
VESYTPKSSLVAASASPDTAKTSSGGDPGNFLYLLVLFFPPLHELEHFQISIILEFAVKKN